MINDLSIAIECWADTILIETLVPPSKSGYSHFSSCFHVEAVMTQGALRDKFAIGIIDDDKNSIKYLKEFEEWVNYDDSLKLWVHPNKPHYIIQFSPALEKWILKNCEQGHITLEDYELSNNLTELKRYTKHLASKNNNSGVNKNRLKNLFTAFKNRDDIEEVRLLKRWIQLLKEKNYQIDKEELKNV